MKTRIIFIDNFDNIKIKDLIGIENSHCKKYYKKIENKVIEVIYYTSLDRVSKMLSLDNMIRSILVIKEINSDNIDLIKKLYRYNITLVVGIANCEINCELLNDISYFPQLIDSNDIIDLDLFIFTINNGLVNKNNKPQYILFGREEEKKACGSIPIFILKRFEKIQRLKNFHLELYYNKEMNIEQISYVEDCIREYIEDNSVLRINQIKSSYDDNNTYFILCAQ